MTRAFTHRIATMEDVPALRELMHSAIGQLQKDFLTPAQIAASFDVMGLDTQLIIDGTYFVIEAQNPADTHSLIVGCGGWSWRNTLFGANHTSGRNAAPLDPKYEPARIRAMYTHPAWARQGIGRLIMLLCENAARKNGFSTTRLAATLAGQPLYEVCGYRVIAPFTATANNGVEVPLLTMEKNL